jgi:hypothetical protein
VHIFILRKYTGELQTHDQVNVEGKAEDQHHHDPDHFQVICWKAEAVLREGQIFLLGLFPPGTHTYLGKNRSRMKYLVK